MAGGSQLTDQLVTVQFHHCSCSVFTGTRSMSICSLRNVSSTSVHSSRRPVEAHALLRHHSLLDDDFLLVEGDPVLGLGDLGTGHHLGAVRLS